MVLCTFLNYEQREHFKYYIHVLAFEMCPKIETIFLQQNSIFNGPESDLDEGISEIEQSSEIDEIIKELEASNDNSAVIRLDTEQDDPIIDQNIVLQLDAENERDVDSLLPVLQSASQAGSGPIVVINIRFLHLLKL